MKMGRQRFLHEFAIILLLAVAISMIAFQTNSHFTGYAVIELNYTTETECLANNGTWTNTTELQNVTSQIEVIIGGNCSNLTYADEANCVINNYTWTNTTELQNVTSQIEVIIGGNCTGKETNESAETCVEQWDCEHWSECEDESQTRSCADSASCGTTENKPIIERLCTVEDEEETTQETNEETITPIITTTHIEAEIIQTCTPNMQCGEWQECINGSQIRICTDTNNCNPDEIASTESQECVVEIKETCSDKIKNQDETGIDCGGKCKQCSLFTIVGSVISGTVGSVFADKTRIFIFLGVIFLAVAGFFVFRFFSKKKKKTKK
jgi:hypothetical protein